MTKREILHLHNRFGFGLLHNEVEKLCGLSNKELVNRLIKSSEQTSQLSLNLAYLSEFKSKKLDGDTKKLLRDILIKVLILFCFNKFSLFLILLNCNNFFHFRKIVTQKILHSLL